MTEDSKRWRSPSLACVAGGDRCMSTDRAVACCLTWHDCARLARHLLQGRAVERRTRNLPSNGIQHSVPNPRSRGMPAVRTSSSTSYSSLAAKGIRLHAASSAEFYISTYEAERERIRRQQRGAPEFAVDHLARIAAKSRLDRALRDGTLT